MHVLPSEWAAATPVLDAILPRVDADAGATQLLVITADADAAVGIADALARARAGTPPRVVAATGADRTARVLRAGAAPVVIGAPSQLLALLRGSALKMDAVRWVAIAWLDEILAGVAGDELEAVLADVPKDAARIVITSTTGASVEDFLERHARRAYRVGTPPAASTPAGGDAAATSIAYHFVEPSLRNTALRRVLDELDPPSAVVSVRSAAGEAEARATLAALGYTGPSASVRVVRDAGAAPEQGAEGAGNAAGGHAALLVLYELPHTPEEWRRVARGAPVQTVALLLPRQLGHLRAVTGAAVTPLPLPGPADRARARDAALRAELARELADVAPQRELLALEPLLTDFDGLTIAAAAVRLLERVRAAAGRRSEAAGSARPPAVAADARETGTHQRPAWTGRGGTGGRPGGARPHDRGAGAGRGGDPRRDFGDRPRAPRGPGAGAGGAPRGAPRGPHGGGGAGGGGGRGGRGGRGSRGGGRGGR